MNPLRELGARIVADVNALLLQREPPLLEPLADDDLDVTESTTPAGRKRRRDEAAAAVDPLAAPEIPSGMPVRGVLNSHYGMRFHPIHKKWMRHRGEDIAAPSGTSVVTTARGVVAFAGWRGGLGNMVEVNHGAGYRTRYAHLSRIDVRAGTPVTRGSIVGAVGRTGTATGNHLHFEVLFRGRHVDPKPFLR